MRTQSWLFALGLVLIAASSGSAQSFGSADINHVYRFGASVPYDGMPYTQRYSYGTGANLYFNGDGRQLWYLDYLDRLERSRKFGYPEPTNPYGPYGPAQEIQAPRTRVGIGFGWFRGR